VKAGRLAAGGGVALTGLVFSPLLLALVAVSGTAPADASCGISATSVVADLGTGLTDAQRVNASAIIAQGRATPGIDDRGIVIALATAYQESSLFVLDHGDTAGPDSRGLFQQRDSWGSLADRMDPARSAGLFYRALLAVPGWQSLPVTVAAQTVQRSRYPDAYARWEAPAVAILGAAGAATATACSGAPVATVAGTDPGPGPQTGADHLTPRARNLEATVRAAFPELVEVGCWRASDPYPDHPSGRACDFMLPDNGQTPAGVALGDRVADYVWTNGPALGVDYQIWRQRIRNPGKEWRPMGDRDGWTANHMDHVHVTVLA
jgi:hypothetical protein